VVSCMCCKLASPGWGNNPRMYHVYPSTLVALETLQAHPPQLHFLGCLATLSQPCMQLMNKSCRNHHYHCGPQLSASHACRALCKIGERGEGGGGGPGPAQVEALPCIGLVDAVWTTSLASRSPRIFPDQLPRGARVGP
jgi:hypothetical protein